MRNRTQVILSLPLLVIVVLGAIIVALGHFWWFGFIAAKKELTEVYFNLNRIIKDAWNS